MTNYDKISVKHMLTIMVIKTDTRYLMSQTFKNGNNCGKCLKLPVGDLPVGKLMKMFCPADPLKLLCKLKFHENCFAKKVRSG